MRVLRIYKTGELTSLKSACQKTQRTFLSLSSAIKKTWKVKGRFSQVRSWTGAGPIDIFHTKKQQQSIASASRMHLMALRRLCSIKLSNKKTKWFKKAQSARQKIAIKWQRASNWTSKRVGKSLEAAVSNEKTKSIRGHKKQMKSIQMRSFWIRATSF